MSPEAIRPFVPALVLSLCAMLLSQGIGLAFGAIEDEMKASLQADADAVLATVYGGDADKAKSVVGRSWSYYKRAHLHAGALGTFALALTLLLAFLSGPLLVRRLCAIAVSVGAIGYGTFWLIAGMRAPRLGGTDAAKESLAWLAQPTSALIFVGTVASLVLVVLQLRVRRTAPAA